MSSWFERVRQAGPSNARATGYVFGAVFALSFAITAVTVWLASSAPGGGGNVAGPIRNIFISLGLNFILIGGLGAMVGWRVWRIFITRDQDVGAKLHLRYISLFALAAAVPAVVVALFFGLLVNQGVDSWFSSKIRTVVDNHSEVANAYLAMQVDRLNQDLQATHKDLNTYAPQLQSNSVKLNDMLGQQAAARGFWWIYLVDDHGKAVAKGERPGAPPYSAPPASDLAEAERDPKSAPTIFVKEEDLALVVFRVATTPAYYAVIAAPLPPGLLDRLDASSKAVAAYREADANRGRVQMVFLVSYMETALLVLVGAVWLGIGAATAISAPVSRLVGAANRVASGDLNVRVETSNEPEELKMLALSFNRMTDDLQAQQAALRTASVEAESRRQFIETVLSGVSAGVIGLDETSRVSVYNSQALRLLGLEGQSIHGLPLADAAPELLALADRAMVTGSEIEEDIDLLRGRETRHLRVRATGHGHGSDGLVLTFDDITKLISAQRNAAWKDVARRIAHEIKNPLTPIQLSAERIRRKYRSEIKGDLETFDRCTETIIRQVGDIGRMVDEFSAFARMPAPKFAPADAIELLREAVFARRVAEPDIIFELIEDPDVGDFVCDERMVAQALTNVLKNAAEAVAARRQEDHTLQGRIQARLSGDRLNVIFEIEDNGIGLPDKDRARLTEPYVTTREKGTGLGLAIVKRILEDHAGHLFLRDPPKIGRKVQRGALVTLQFPRGDASPEAVTSTQTHEEA
jgi:two-component system nitrogen regulation sensor histidine kinase NtrY